MTIKERIMKKLKKNPTEEYTAKELGKILSVKRTKSIWTSLNKLIEEGLIQKRPDPLFEKQMKFSLKTPPLELSIEPPLEPPLEPSVENNSSLIYNIQHIIYNNILENKKRIRREISESDFKKFEKDFQKILFKYFSLSDKTAPRAEIPLVKNPFDEVTEVTPDVTWINSIPFDGTTGGDPIFEQMIESEPKAHVEHASSVISSISTVERMPPTEETRTPISRMDSESPALLRTPYEGPSPAHAVSDQAPSIDTPMEEKPTSHGFCIEKGSHSLMLIEKRQTEFAKDMQKERAAKKGKKRKKPGRESYDVKKMKEDDELVDKGAYTPHIRYYGLNNLDRDYEFGLAFKKIMGIFFKTKFRTLHLRENYVTPPA